MKGKMIIKILEGKKKGMPKEEKEEKEESSEDSYEFSDKEAMSAQMKVGSETLSGKDLVKFVDQYRDLLMKDESINPFE